MNKQDKGHGRRGIEWRSIPGYEGLYEVSGDGQIRGLTRVVARKGQSPIVVPGKTKTTPINNRWGYVQVNLSKDGVDITHRVHKLVAEVFLGPRPQGADINHIDGNKQNNTAANLEYCTRKENLEHARRLGLYDKRGEKHHGARLTNEQVLEIRRLHGDGITGRELSRRFGVQPSQISRIVLRQDWKHL